MKDILNKLIEHKSLDKELSRQILLELAQGKYNNSQVAAFLTVYMMRSITVDELEGFRDAMLELCLSVPIDEYDAIDLCGTGGDGKDTFNISTLASFVVAGAGQNVAKHGNNGVSSVCGSSNLLAHFGYEFTNDIGELKRSLDQANICFLHAPLFHPAMKNVAPIRQELGVKTFFNMLGPMVNPSFPKKQLVGVFSLELARLYGYLYQKTDKDFIILHTLDGYDEVSLTGRFKMISNQGEQVLGPEDLGLQTVKRQEISGGKTVEESAKTFDQILKGQGTSAQNAVVIANAGMALYSANREAGLDYCINKAEESLLSGRALKAFQRLISRKKIYTIA
ncbi:Anthranilate phosphoribosyltransferase [Fulvivirga imtechensis AK7]|uniref:Anthranilate phosphoribosyltransferase n=1 Tax=Fulvivirga imtechensis AK7 TaxID=1237149 RepID=L8JPI2_9BACT|nr:anthranilate phosphoribosyltransferase [Fulvivirga imtechensis]ELR70866.1 Anthranilate phosphoribosyltransferase [Fulvivirga imtechensis AK7]